MQEYKHVNPAATYLQNKFATAQLAQGAKPFIIDAGNCFVVHFTTEETPDYSQVKAAVCDYLSNKRTYRRQLRDMEPKLRASKRVSASNNFRVPCAPGSLPGAIRKPRAIRPKRAKKMI